MNKLAQTLCETDGIPSFCADLSGTILSANQAALELLPDCVGQTIDLVLPEFYPNKYPLDLASFDYHHTLRAKNGKRLDISRFDDILLCRLLPEIPALQDDLDRLPEAVREANLDQIRASVEKALRSHSLIEDVFSDLDLFDKKIYQEVTDTLYESNSSCRRICLACDRLEMTEEPSTDRYPPQRVILTDALWNLVHSIRVSLPGLAMQVRENLPPYPIAVRANWELLQRAILEIIRHSAAAANKRSGSTVFGVELLETKDSCIIRLSDNYSGMLSPDDEQEGEENPARIYRYIERVMAYFGGSVNAVRTDSGDNALDLALPLQPDSYTASFAFTKDMDAIHASLLYEPYEKQNLSAPLIYLEEFAKQ